MRTLVTLLTLGLAGSAAAQTPNPLAAEIDARVDQALPSIIEWRRDLHQHPELGNREFRTAKVIARPPRASASDQRRPASPDRSLPRRTETGSGPAIV
jgi:hypothetical protein